MAHLPAGTSTQRTYVVRSGVVVYGFPFDIAGPADVRVEYAMPGGDFEAVDRTKYAVSRFAAGGEVRFLSATEVPSPVLLQAAGQVRITRSTEVARVTDFGGEAYARGASVDTALDHLVRIAQEVVAQAGVAARLDSLVSVRIDGGDIVFGTEDGGEERVTIPVQTLAMTAAQVAKLDAIEAGAQVNPTSAQVKALYDANTDRAPFTPAREAKLQSIAANAEPNQSAADIRRALFGSADPTLPLTAARAAKLDALPSVPGQTAAQVAEAVAERTAVAQALLAGALIEATLSSTVSSRDVLVRSDAAVDTGVSLTTGGLHAVSVDGRDWLVFADDDLATFTPSTVGSPLQASFTAVSTVQGTAPVDGAVRVSVGKSAANRILVSIDPPRATEYAVRVATYTPRAGGGTGAGLTATQRQDLQQAVRADRGITLSDRELRFQSADVGEGETRINIPGISVEDNGNIEGTGNSVVTLNFAGTGVSVSRSNGKATVTITGGQHAQSGLTSSQVDARIEANEHVQDAESLNDALHRDVELTSGSADMQVALSNAMAAIPGVVLPVDTGDRHIKVKVDSGRVQEWRLAQLLDLTPLQDPSQGSDANTLHWTEGGVTYRIAPGNRDSQLLFGADTPKRNPGYGVTVWDVPTYVKPEFLPPATATAQGAVTLGALDQRYDPRGASGNPQAVLVDQTGLSASDDGSFPVYKDGATPPFIPAAIDDTANLRAAYTEASWKLYPQGKLGALVDATTGGGWRDSTVEVSTTALSARPSRAAAEALSYTQSQTTGPLQTNVWLVAKVPLAKVGLVALGRLRLDVDDDEVPSIVVPDGGHLEPHASEYRAFEYYAFLVPDLPASGTYKLEENDPLRLNIQQPSGTTHFRELFPGLTITNPSVDYIQSAPTALQDAAGAYLDIDSDETGDLNLALHLRMDRPSPSLPNLAFRRGVANATVNEQETVRSITVPLRDLNEESAFVANRDPTNWNGIEALSVPVWNGTTSYGQYEVFVTWQAQGAKRRVGVIAAWDSDGSGTSGVGWTFAAELRVSRGSADVAAGGGVGGGLDQAAVDARVAAGVADWAEEGDTTPIPAGKLTNVVRRTFAAIATGLNGLSGAARLSYTALRDTPAAAGAPVQARATTSTAFAAWGGVSTGSNSGRVVAAPAPQTVGLSADGAIPSGFSLASNVFTIAAAGRVRIDADLRVDTNNTAPGAVSGGNNSRSDVECFIERAASGSSTFAEIPGSHSATQYMRVAKPYWNHGPGEAHIRTAVDFIAAAGDQVRFRVQATFNQASTTQHRVMGGHVVLTR